MIEGFLTLPVLLPILFWGVYHYHKDRHLPEPASHLLIAFVLGIGAAFLSRAAYMGLEPLGLRFDAVQLAADNPAGLFAFAILAIGPIEEISKMLPFVLVIIRFREFDEPIDSIIYASFIALGYATVENIHYLQFLSPLEAAARGFAGPVVHIVFASIWAHWIGDAWLEKRSLVGPISAGVALAALLHGFYDFLVLLNPMYALPIAGSIVVAIWIWRLYLLRRLHHESVAQNPEPPERASDDSW